jgi:WXG100 family type VII secretion target
MRKTQHLGRQWTVSTVADAFSVNPDALANAVQQMTDFVQHTESVVAEIDSLVTHLHGTWSGQAAAAHAEAHRHWSQGEATMRQALAQLKAAGSAAHHNYTGAMATNKTMWS